MYDLLFLAQVYLVDKLKEMMETVIVEDNILDRSRHRLAEHFILNRATLNDKVEKAIYESLNADFFHSPILTTLDANTWKLLLSRKDHSVRTWESWDDCLTGVLKWAVSNKNHLEKDQVTE